MFYHYSSLDNMVAIHLTINIKRKVIYSKTDDSLHNTKTIDRYSKSEMAKTKFC